MDFIAPTQTAGDNYNPANFVFFRNGWFDPCNAYMLQAIPRLPTVGTYTVRDTANRPDTISSDIFNPGNPQRGDPQYWWLLCVYNNLWNYVGPSNYLSIPVGTVIKYFSLDALERLVFSLRAKQGQYK